MIRQTRRASVLIAFCVLTSAATASAECAWVLWEGTSTEKAPMDTAWALKTAHETRRECQAALTEAVVRGAATWQSLGARIIPPSEKGSGRFVRLMGDGKGYAYMDSDTKQLLIMKADCLPDTVDPRGPKAGGR